MRDSIDTAVVNPIFWAGIECPDEARDTIEKAKAQQVLGVFRAAGYRKVLESRFDPQRLDIARDKLLESEPLLNQARRAFVIIFDAAGSEPKDGFRDNMAGLHLKQALRHLADGQISEACPIIPAAVQIAKKVRALAATA